MIINYMIRGTYIVTVEGISKQITNTNLYIMWSVVMSDLKRKEADRE